jgi:hypothetical protein
MTFRLARRSIQLVASLALGWGVVCALGVCLANACLADELQVAQALKTRSNAPAPKPAPEPVDPAEANVLEFVREHHPELRELLSQLKASRPREYEKAVRDLSRVRDRLFAMSKTNDERYAVELANWKTETRIQLLAAKLHMGENAELLQQLRQALSEQVDLRRQLLQFDRAAAEERLQRLDAQIQRLDQDRSQAIERQLQILTRSPARSAPSANKSTPAPSTDQPAPSTKKPAAAPQ